MVNELSLFTGAGGGILGSILLGWRTVGYVEIDPYCQAVIRQRQIDGIYDDAPIFGDIREFNGFPWCGVVDIVTAGFPCQPFSVAGKCAGADDERNMWPETLRIIREVRPRFAFLENVPGLISSGYFETILCDLAESGYDAEWCVLGAIDVGAPHSRKRLFILAANANRDRLQGQHTVASTAPSEKKDWDDIKGVALEIFEGKRDCIPSSWVFGKAYGIPHRVNRLKAIGNGQVPAVVRAAWIILSEGLR